MTHGSLFSGIGGFDLGFERAGIKTVWQVEIDPFCRKVLERHFPDARRFTNITKILPYELPRVDVISGGFPCQDISDAGNGRAGLAGSRSGLWFEMHRIIGELRPQFVVVENVPALLKRGMGDVLAGLAEFGFDAEWCCIPASFVGAPHKRERIFLVAYSSEIGWSDGINNHAQHEVPGNPLWQFTQNLKSGREWKRWAIEASQAVDRQISAQDFCELDDGLSEELDAIGAAGNSIVPQIAEWIGKRIIECERISNGD